MLTKHFYPLLVVLFLLGSGLGAQSATFLLPNATGQPGETICLPIRVMDFTDIAEFGFSLTWDDEALNFQSIQNINPSLTGFNVLNQAPGANIEGINTIASAAGLITAYWRLWENNMQCGDLSSGLTLADDVVLFEVCLTIIGQGYGDIQNINFFNAPQDIIANKWIRAGLCTNTTGSSAVLGTVNGSITEGVDPLIMGITIPPGNFQPGDLVCVDVVAESGFVGLVGLQFGLDWDRNFLQVRSVDPNEDIPQNFSYNVDQINNCFSAAWSYTSVTPPLAITLAPNTVFATVCFEIIGGCNQQTPISITESCAGAPIEATNLVANNNNRIPVVTNNTQFRTQFCNARGFQVVANCGAPVNVGEQICVAIQAGDNFNSIQRFGYNINFNPNVLQYVSQGGFNSNLAMNNGDFDATNVANGVLNVDYNASPLGPRTLAAGAQVFEVCFNVIGYAPSTPITFSNGSVSENVAMPPLVSINPSNCAVAILQPDQVIMSFGSEGFSSTTTTCIPVTVANFENINNISFFIQYDAAGTLFDFVSVANNALPGATITPAGSGLLQVTYSGAPISLADGSLLFDLCLRARTTAIPNECSSISVSTFPPPAASNPDNTIGGILSNPGEGCVLFPEGFGLEIGSATMGIDSNLCIPVSVVSFDNILSANFSFSFSPALLEFGQVNILNWPGLSPGNFDLSSINIGIIGVSWANGSAVAIPDGTVAFELCFNTLSTPDCSTIDGFSDQEPSSTTSNGNGSILFTDGQICVEDRLKITNTVEVVPSCVDVCNGKLVLEATAGSPEAGNIFVRVDNPLQTVAIGDTIRNLCSGWVFFTLYNTGRPDLILRDSVFMEFDETQVVTARARAIDPILGCSNNASVAIGAAGNIGSNYLLYILSGANRTLVGQGNINPDGSWTYFASSSGTYLLQVRNQAGCSAYDTVTVLPPLQPIAIAGPDTAITCTNPSIVLTGEGSTTEGIVNYRWERIAGGEVVGVVGNSLELTVTEAGRYRLAVTYLQTMCIDSSTVDVLDFSIPPNLNVAGAAALGCDGSAVSLNAGSAEPGLIYTWRDEEGNIVSSDPIFSTATLGNYTITLENSANGCTAEQVIEVLPNQGAPVIAPTTIFNLNCSSDTLSIGVEATGISGSSLYTWSTEDGTIVIGNRNLPNPQIFGPGSYTVIVDNGGCSDTATVVVQPAILPVVNLNTQANLLCDGPLTISDNNPNNPDYTYQWYNGSDSIVGATANEFQPTTAGTYILEVSIASTACRARDTIDVLAPIGFPVIMLADTIFGLTCNNAIAVAPLVNLNNYSLGITGPGSPILDPDNPAAVLVNSPGMHTITVTNTDNGCTASTSFIVDDLLTTPPFAALTQPEVSISCISPSILLNGSLSSSNANITYVWSSEEGGEDPNMQGQDTLRVGSAGLYILTVLNTATGCSASDSIRVIDTRVFPVVDSLPVMNLTCQVRSSTLGIQIADTTGLNIQWFGFGGLLASGVLSYEVTTGGTYTAVVVDNLSSCVTQQSFFVLDEADEVIEIGFAPVAPFDCSVASVTLDASQSLANPSPSDTISWLSLNGNTITPATGSLIVNVNGPGSYILSIRSAGGCVATDTVFIDAANNTPFADAGEDTFISCGETPSIGGSGTTPPALDTFLYAWTALSGGTILGNATAPTAIASGVGVYELVVTNIYNSCEDRDTVSVSIDQQEAATLPANYNICEDNTIVMGNLPAATTAVWTTTGAVQAQLSTEGNTATITALSGSITLIYTLSAPGCENYSADTITISRENPPVAIDDQLFIQGNGGFGRINLLDNDQRNGPVTVTLLDEVPFGDLVFLNGDFSFEAGQGVSGEFTLAYEICSNTCDLCDQGLLTVRVDASGERPAVYNAITPNGDGLNETLIFDILNVSGQEFPNNELIVFNRWGDILYEAKPYTNDWNGTNKSGQEIPEGTYYYILRLDIGQGEIIRGDVTIIR